MKIVDVAVERPVMMTMVILSAVVMGLFSLTGLPVDLLPEIDFPIVTVRTIYPGGGPEEIETQISEKIEDAVSSVSGIKNLRSISMEAVSVVVIEFDLGIDVDVAAADVKDQIDQIKSTLPDDAKDPTVVKINLNAKPVITMAVSGERSLEEVYQIVDKTIKDQLNRVNGVASVDIIGAKEREILVSVIPEKLDAYNISIMQVIQAVAGGNIELPGGKINSTHKEFTVRLSGEYLSIEEISNIEIPLMGRLPLRLKDVAEVIDTFKDQRELVRLNDQTGVGLSILKKSNANIVDVAHGLKDRIKELEQDLPDDIKMEVMLDNSLFIEASIQDLIVNMLIGTILTGLLLYMFLHSFRGVIIAGVSIPVSILATFNLIRFAGFTVNFMSLMALAISVGILVSNAIVVLENIQRHIEKGDLKDNKTASKIGTTEIGIAVIASTLTNIVVFTPIAFMEGMVGQFFKQFGLTVTFATIFSLLTAFTLTPMLSARLLKKAELGDSIFAKFAHSFEKMYQKFAQLYRRGVEITLHHRIRTFIIINVLFFGTLIALGPYMGFGFFVEADQGLFTIKIKMPPGSNLEQTDKAVLKIEQILAKRKGEIDKVYTTLGKATGSVFVGSNTGVDIAELIVDIGDRGDRDNSVKEFYESLRSELALEVPSAEINLRAMNPAGGGDAPIQLHITGEDLKTLVPLALKAENAFRNTASLVDITSSWESGKPEVKIIPRRDVISEYGLSVAQMALALRYSIDGNVATEYKESGNEYDIRIRLSDDLKNNIDQLRKMTFLTPKGKVPITELCDIEESSGPTQINRKNKNRLITLTAGIGYGALGNVVADLKTELEKMDWPTGYNYFFAGFEERRQESQSEIGKALLLAIILTYMLLAAVLESFIEPIFIMMTVPLALVGVVLFLVMTDNPVDIFSMMAVVMLVGIVVNNAILILDYIHLLRKQGMELTKAILEACHLRLRPILMSNAAVVLGMLPLALGIGKGAEMRAPMAIVSIGGIASSTAFTLFLLPMLYYTFKHWQEKRTA
ncbi:MAG: efflux RND transporter permease subunit [Calditrichaeota bacterium]|nr:MAG: AcrB/AcrD/AcrF family protein [Calditrichota bacterium]MBL1208015.1 efflux RND transporter permease subunit [Calditrichota bacterium]NOG47851.1 efflux RND transporter permease subunit [Calditrichota bacterium]